jgi:hypothetical protein
VLKVVALLYLPILLLVAALVVVCLVLSYPYRMFRDRREAEQRRIGRPLSRVEYLFAERIDAVSARYTAVSYLRGLAYLAVCPVGWVASAFAGLLINTFGSYD